MSLGQAWGAGGQQSQGLGFTERPGCTLLTWGLRPQHLLHCSEAPLTLGGSLLCWGQQEWEVLAFILA